MGLGFETRTNVRATQLKSCRAHAAHPAAPYLAKAEWIQVHPRECALSKRELRTMVAQAYALIVAKLSKKAQRELGMLP